MREEAMSVTIFTMTHKKFPTPGDLIYVPCRWGVPELKT